MSGTAPPLRDPHVGQLDARLETRGDGTLIVHNTRPLGAYPAKLTERLEHWARVAPDRIFLAERAPASGAWRSVTYAQTLAQVRAIATALLQRPLSVDRPIVILSGNEIEHALLGLAAFYAGIPYAPIAPAYALVSQDFQKLRHVCDLLTPGLVYASDAGAFARAITMVLPEDVEIAARKGVVNGRRTTPFDDLLATTPTDAVDAAHAAVGPDTIGKFLFTSGSTGVPKGVINTQRMMCANMEMATAHFEFMRDEPPIVLDWSPWNHTAGGNHNFNLILYNGGTLYIDEGKPTTNGIHATVRNLKEVAPTWYFNVPKGFDALVPFLRADDQLRQNLFSRVRMFWYAGAGMAHHLWEALDQLAVETVGERIPILSGLGSTETAPFALAADTTMMGAGRVGLPARGVELKLVPSDGRYEARMRGLLTTPGYWRQPKLTAKAFDEEGFYKIGDALRFTVPGDVTQGFSFDGRIAEDFKLSTGTWVSVGSIRGALIDAFAPYVQDAVIAGLDGDYLAALLFPNLSELSALAPDMDPRGMCHAAEVRIVFQERLDKLRRSSTGSSNRVERIVLLDEPPSMDRGEMTDKGSINQRAVLGLRATLVKALYADAPAPPIVVARR